jgi:hypothetical protein
MPLPDQKPDWREQRENRRVIRERIQRETLALMRPSWK